MLWEWSFSSLYQEEINYDTRIFSEFLSRKREENVRKTRAYFIERNVAQMRGIQLRIYKFTLSSYNRSYFKQASINIRLQFSNGFLRL